ALYVELGDLIDDALAARARALAAAWEAEGHGSAVPAYASVVARFDPLRLLPADAEAKVVALAKSLDRTSIEAGRVVEIPTYYDGPDLAETAERSQLSVDELVKLHTS